MLLSSFWKRSDVICVPSVHACREIRFEPVNPFLRLVEAPLRLGKMLPFFFLNGLTLQEQCLQPKREAHTASCERSGPTETHSTGTPRDRSIRFT